MLTEADGGPVGIVIAPANRHDSLLLQDALEAVIVEPPDPRTHRQGLCLDKAFDGASSEATAIVFGYEPHVRRIGEEKLDPASGEKTRPARRWVVERTIGWLNRCRGSARNRCNPRPPEIDDLSRCPLALPCSRPDRRRPRRRRAPGCQAPRDCARRSTATTRT